MNLNIDKYIIPTKLLSIDNGTDEYRKARLIGWTLLVVILFMIIGIPIHWILSNYMGSYINALMLIFSLIVYFFYKKKGNFVITGNLIATIAYLEFLCLIILAFNSTSLVIWFIVSPISAFLYANKSSGVIWGGITIITLFIYFGIPFFGYSYPHSSLVQLSDSKTLLFNLNSILFLFI
ncbi:hypothetical protein WAF17_10540 [Bernardetia sp. ABR2-2B]|uniref:hypothetical protein n=1 Tax=Bernardetia sp. ABR2-2B TaxID=3127472 RepID=UPI0030D1914E